MTKRENEEVSLFITFFGILFTSVFSPPPLPPFLYSLRCLLLSIITVSLMILSSGALRTGGKTIEECFERLFSSPFERRASWRWWCCSWWYKKIIVMMITTALNSGYQIAIREEEVDDSSPSTIPFHLISSCLCPNLSVKRRVPNERSTNGQDPFYSRWWRSSLWWSWSYMKKLHSFLFMLILLLVILSLKHLWWSESRFFLFSDALYMHYRCEKRCCSTRLEERWNSSMMIIILILFI